MNGMRPYGKSEQLAKRRKRALKLLESGKRVKEVAKTIGVTERSIRYWQKEEKEPKDKSKVRSPGHPSHLSEEQLKQLVQDLLRGAYEQGYAEDYWTLDRIARLIWDKFKVRYHPGSVWYIMKRIGWSSQRPQRQALQRDDETIVRWKKYAWPRIKKVA
jgi:transposase